MCVWCVLTLALCLLASCPRESAPALQPAQAEPAAKRQVAAAQAPEPDGRQVIDARPDFPQEYTTDFLTARHTGAAGKLSDLDLTIELAADGEQLESRNLTVSATDLAPVARFDLPEYRIEIAPLIEPPIQLEAQQYGSYGGYRVKLFSPELTPIATFEIDKKGELARADSQGGFSARVLLAAPQEMLYTYAIFTAEDKASEPLLAVEFEIDDFNLVETTDAGGATYSYRLPVLIAKIHGKRLAADMRLNRNTNQQAVSHDPYGGFWEPIR